MAKGIQPVTVRACTEIGNFDGIVDKATVQDFLDAIPNDAHLSISGARDDIASTPRTLCAEWTELR